MENIIKKLQKYLNFNIHRGCEINKWNPKMAPYILGKDGKYHVINIFKTAKCLILAGNILKQKILNQEKILLVGTDKISSVLIEEEAKKANIFYINHHWLGGTLTNWDTIKKAINQLNILENNLINVKYSKKDTLKLNKKLIKLKYLFDGIKNMETLPDIVIFSNQQDNHIGIQECIKLGIPTICIVNTTCNPDIISYPIPGNTKSLKSISFILKYLIKKICLK